MSIDNKKLNQAKSAKKDEFYTQYRDIEEELQYYIHNFEDKIVYCNCDDPEWSNFWKYFYNNFHKLKLKKLISTHWTESVASKPSYKLEYDGEAETKTYLQGDGDFQSPECMKILEECDIVVTNPPFSLWQTYFSTLTTYNKKFLIIGNMNAVTYKEVLPHIMANTVWLGHSIHSGDREFRIPDDYPVTAYSYRIDEDGNKFVRVKAVRWFTNLKSSKPIEILNLTQSYNSEKYPKYDNSDAINVNKTCDIPFDYYEEMGVPISFIDKYNPEQFEIIGLVQCPFVEGKALYKRILIKRKV